MWEGQSSPAGLTFSHVLGIVRNQVIVRRWEKAWDGLISWLSLVFSLVHRSPTVPTSADCVCVYGYLLPKCTIWEKESMSMPVFTTNEMAHKISLPALHTHYHRGTECGEMQLCIQSTEMETCSVVHRMPEEKLWSWRGKGQPSSCAALLWMCSLAATKTGWL